MAQDPFASLARVARRQFGLFSVGQAEDCGLSRQALRTLRRRGQVHRLNAHVYEIAGTPDSRRKRLLAALLAAGPRAVLSHTSAGWLHGLFDVTPDGIDLLYPRERGRRRVGGARIRTTGTLRTSEDVVRLGPFRVTSVERTICDLASVLDERTLRLVVLDAIRRGLTTAVAIDVCLRRLGRCRGAPELRTILGECDPQLGRARSTWEAEALTLVRRAGVPRPVVNLVIRDSDGTPRYELDLAWPHLLFAYEFQSRRFHTITPDAARDQRKRRELESEGWAIKAVPLDLVRDDPNAFVTMVRRDLAEATRRCCDDPVRGFSRN
jgi:hypothetical protein